MYKIAAMRKKKNMQQKELAEMVGIGNEWLCNVEKGKRRPSMTLLYKIAEALDCDIKDLF